MKDSQLIRIMKEPLKQVISHFGKDDIEAAFFSKTIAYSIWLHKNHKITNNDITDKNNVFGLVNNDGDVISYSNIEECILQYLANGNVKESEFDNEYDTIAKEYNLYNLDKEYLNGIEGNIINLDEEKSKPIVDQYTVQENDGSEIMKTSNLEEANKVKEEGQNRTVRNSRNRIVNNGNKYKSNSAVSVVLKPGAQIECENLNLYYKVTDKAPGRSISGTYYLYDVRQFDGRYAICMKPELAGKDKHCVIGFVNAKDLSK